MSFARQTPSSRLRLRRLILGLGFALAAGFAAAQQAEQPVTSQTPAPNPATASAIFGGGCFWCVEADFDKVPGVVATTSGYMGGHVPNPTYEQVSGGESGHVEVVKIDYDPEKTTYEALLKVYWRSIDPLTANAQFCDTGPQYRSAIFVLDDAQKGLAEASRAAVAQIFAPQPVVTEILPAAQFYPAEGYHQDFYVTNPVRYRFYRWNCGRDARLKELWGGDAWPPPPS